MRTLPGQTGINTQKDQYDMRIDSHGKTQTSTNGFIRKRCGLEFKSLSKTHKKQLEVFLRNHVVGVTRETVQSVQLYHFIIYIESKLKDLGHFPHQRAHGRIIS